MMGIYIGCLTEGTRIISGMNLGKKVLLLLWVAAVSSVVYTQNPPLPHASFQIDVAVVLLLCFILIIAIVVDLAMRLYRACSHCQIGENSSNI